jgi:phage tail sheath protein FI
VNTKTSFENNLYSKKECIMPVPLTYPGVYVEEISSGVRTITGVATSITAFIGRALRGPCDEPVTINSFGDFERIFGGLWVDSSLGYAVHDFYLNGGSQAVIVRLYNAEKDGNGNVIKNKAKLTLNDTTAGLKLEAAYEGKWGANLHAAVDVNVSKDVATNMGLNKEELFNLTIMDASTGLTERYLNVSYRPSARRIDKVLESESKMVRWDSDPDAKLDPNKLPPIKPDPIAVTAAEKDVAVSEKNLVAAKKELEAAQNANPQVPAEIATAKTALDIAKTALQTAQGKLAKAKKPITDAVTTAEQALADALKADPQSPDNIATARRNLEEIKTARENAVSDGNYLKKSDNFTPVGAYDNKKGLYALEKLFAKGGLFNLLCIPPYNNDNKDIEDALIEPVIKYCEDHRAMFLYDSPSSWEDTGKMHPDILDKISKIGRSKNAAIFFPRLKQPNPLRDNQIEEFAPCGAIAGIMARTDTQRGVWKAPAGIDATLKGVSELSVKLTDAENGQLNPLGINCLRSFPNVGKVVWGSRTLDGYDQNPSDWKYIPVRRLALFIEESLFRGTQWVVFEPNDEPLWAQIRLNVGSFMHNLFRQGAFQGTTPKQAYFVKCDKETTPQNDIDQGIVNIMVGFAPLKPAEFVVIKLQQIAGNLEV